MSNPGSHLCVFKFYLCVGNCFLYGLLYFILYNKESLYYIVLCEINLIFITFAVKDNIVRKHKPAKLVDGVLEVANPYWCGTMVQASFREVCA